MSMTPLSQGEDVVRLDMKTVSILRAAGPFSGSLAAIVGFAVKTSIMFPGLQEVSAAIQFEGALVESRRCLASPS
jgi:hypothetical protein